MKTLLILLIALFCTSSYAVDCETTSQTNEVQDALNITTDVPKFLEGATITVRTKDGRESTVPAEKFKVVPRKQQYIVTRSERFTEVTCKAEKEKNRISLLGGNGPRDGLDANRSPTEVTVESRVGAVGGIQYQRLITDKISVGAQGQTNKSILLNVGLDF